MAAAAGGGSRAVGRLAGGRANICGHPECGKAAFAVSRDDTGTVTFRVWSFSRTVDPLARLGSSIARRIQKRVTQRYLEALVDAANEPGKGRTC